MANSLHIVKPCDRKWTDLAGDGARRFCSSCNKFVHNLDVLSRLQIDSVLQDSSSCVTYVPRTPRSGFTVISRMVKDSLAASSTSSTAAASIALSALGACSDRGIEDTPGLSAPREVKAQHSSEAVSAPPELASPVIEATRVEEPALQVLTAEELECLRALGGYGFDE